MSVVDNMFKLNIDPPLKIKKVEKLNNIISNVRENFPFLFKSLYVVIVTVLLYYQDFTILLNEVINNDISSYILAVPFLLAYLVYRVRHYIYAVSFDVDPDVFKGYLRRNELFGCLICIIAYILKWYGSYTFITLEIHMLSFTLFLSESLIACVPSAVLAIVAIAPPPRLLVSFQAQQLVCESFNLPF